MRDAKEVLFGTVDECKDFWKPQEVLLAKILVQLEAIRELLERQ